MVWFTSAALSLFELLLFLSLAALKYEFTLLDSFLNLGFPNIYSEKEIVLLLTELVFFFVLVKQRIKNLQ